MRSLLLPATALGLALLALGAAPATGQSVRFAAATVIVSESAGTVSVAVAIASPGAAASTVQVALALLSTATAGADFTYPTTQTLTFPAGGTANQTLTIPLTDDLLAEPSEYFSLRLLNPTAFPQAALLKNASALGRLNVTNRLGDTDGDGDFDQIYAYGSRSFSILNAATGALVHDSGDLLERLTSTDATYGSIFNASNTTGTPVRKNRSDDKGPEPEGATTGLIRDTTYAFVSLERMGGLVVMNVNDPANPRFVACANNRGLTAGTGDQGPEGLVFVAAANSPTGAPLLILANEISSTVSVYQINLRGVLAARSGAFGPAALYCYPNPAAPSAAVRLSRPVAGALLDGLGRTVRTLPAATDRLDVRGLPAGFYVLRATDGATSRLVVQ